MTQEEKERMIDEGGIDSTNGSLPVLSSILDS